MENQLSQKRTPVHYLATFNAWIKGLNGLLQTVLIAAKLIHGLMR
jgi:hypothetical protein